MIVLQAGFRLSLVLPLDLPSMSVSLLLRLELLPLSCYNLDVNFRLERLDTLHQQFIAAFQYRSLVGLVTNCFDQFVRRIKSHPASGEFKLSKQHNGGQEGYIEQWQQCD